MSHLDPSGCKKRKRGERIFKFKTFGIDGHPVEFNGSFRQNVQVLLECGNLETGLCDGMASWSFQLEVHRNPQLQIFLFVIEEPIGVSINRHCKHCLYAGWGDHVICHKKYHFLVPSKDTAAACLGYEGNFNRTGEFINLMELEGHVMHGVFHSNGFGHLLCINGAEMGSDLAGYQIMKFWDRLCTGLQARKVSLKDKSQKRSMDLRLLHGVACGEPWFGRWGYKFGRGSFGVTEQMYQKAIEAIQNISLYHLLGGISNYEVSSIFARYQTLSGHILVSLGDIFHFILDLKTRLPKEHTIIEASHDPGILVDPTTCRWSPKRIEMATHVIVEALKRAGARWVSRQDVRDAARAYIGDTGLLDFVLKSLGNRVVGDFFVRRCLNPVTKVLEYRLEEITNLGFPNQGTKDSNGNKAQFKINSSRVQLMKDLFCLHKHILKEQNPIGIFATISLASRIILDSKYLIKEYYSEIPSKFEVGLGLGGKSKLYCAIVITLARNGEANEGRKDVVTPYECVTFRTDATIDELTLEVEKIFKEIYWGLRNFTIASVMKTNVKANPKGSDMVFGVVKGGGKVMFEGTLGERGGEIYEGGYRGNYVVDCACGTKEDDGERMVSCDICEVWQHTRCFSIPDSEDIPSIFLCSGCEQDILVLPSLP